MSSPALLSSAMHSRHAVPPRARHRSILVRLPAALFLVALAVCGCSRSPNSGPSGTPSPSRVYPAASPVTSRPSQEQIAAWLTTDLPPIVESISGSPTKLSEPNLALNEFGQEILTVTYERPAVVRTMASDVNLVLLPASGGRFNVSVNAGTLIQPQNGGKLHGITQNLLDYRGGFRSGMRAYLEMRAATMNMTAGKAERVSDVIWFGSEEQLFDAVRRGPPPSVAANAGIPEPVLQPVPSGRISKGTPLWMRCGDRWARGNTLEDENGDRLRLLIYLVRRDKPYLPWVVNLARPDLRIEQQAVVEFQRDPNSFRDLAEANDAKLSRHGAPNKLEPVDALKLEIGTAVLDFWNGMLDPCRTTGPVKDDAVAIQRVGLDNAQMVKSTKGLFVDPFGNPVAP